MFNDFEPMQYFHVGMIIHNIEYSVRKQDMIFLICSNIAIKLLYMSASNSMLKCQIFMYYTHSHVELIAHDTI